jgi:hypothetical protein
MIDEHLLEQIRHFILAAIVHMSLIIIQMEGCINLRGNQMRCYSFEKIKRMARKSKLYNVIPFLILVRVVYRSFDEYAITQDQDAHV